MHRRHKQKPKEAILLKCPKCNDDDYVTYFTKGIPAGKSCLSCGYDSSSKMVTTIKSKKSSITHEAIFIFIVLFAILIIFSITGPFDTTKRFCKSNSDKCVCEDIARMENQKLSYIQPCIDYPDSSTLKLRKKTQAELDIDDCNSNPREDDLCKCEVLLTCKSEHPISNSCKHQSQCLQSRPKTECEKKHFVEGKQVLIGDNSIDGFYQQCLKGNYEGEQCYEGNPDWVEETKIEEVDTSIVPHKECKLSQGWFCPSVGIVNLPCNNITGKCYLDSMGLSYIGCEYKESICLSNQTICREKN